jgi:hypothetical protein
MNKDPNIDHVPVLVIGLAVYFVFRNAKRYQYSPYAATNTSIPMMNLCMTLPWNNRIYCNRIESFVKLNPARYTGIAL